MILNKDLKMMKSERLTDYDDGGGFMTGSEVVSGAVNDLMPDISSLDRISGRVSARLAYYSVQSNNSDTLYGAHIILTKPSADPLVSVFMMKAGREGETRAEMMERYQAYVTKGLLHGARIIDTMFAAQTSLAVSKNGNAFRSNQVIYIGIEYSLSQAVEDVIEDDLPKGGEYVKIKSVEDKGSYQLLRLYHPLMREYPLNYTYIDPTNSQNKTIQPTVIRETNNDLQSAHYYGISPLAAPISIGQSTCQVVATRQPAAPVNVSSVALSNKPLVSSLNARGRSNMRVGVLTTSLDITSGNQSAGYQIALTEAPVDSTLIAVSVVVDGVVRVIQNSVANDFGTIAFISSTAIIDLNFLPDVGSTLAVHLVPDSVYDKHFHGVYNNGNTTIEVGVGREVVRGSVLWPSAIAFSGTYTIDWIRDDGNGVLYKFTTVQTDTATTAYPAGAEVNVSVVGSLNYSTGVITWSGASFPGVQNGQIFCLSRDTTLNVAESALKFHIADSPLAAGSFSMVGTQVDGGAVALASDNLGTITGTGGSGTINRLTGLISLTFTEPTKVESLTFSGIKQESSRLDPAVVSVDSLRLPTDGKVYAFAQNDAAVIFNIDNETLPGGLVADQVFTLNRTNIDSLVIIDQLKQTVPDDRYLVDFVAGTVTFANPLNLAGYTQPLIAIHTVEDRLLISGVSGDGKITFAQPFTKAFGTTGTYVSAILPMGDFKSRVTDPFTQSIDSAWANNQNGDPAAGNYDAVSYPIAIDNEGAVTDRFKLKFKSTSTVDVISEERGVIMSNAGIGAVIAPINPLTAKPFFTIPYQGWDGGWQPGNILRFNTFSASGGVWFIRCTLAGPDTTEVDDVRVQPRGDSA